MRWFVKLFVVLVVVFSVIFVVKLLVDNWVYQLSHPRYDFSLFLLVVSVLPACFFDGLPCKASCRCLVDVDGSVRVVRCSRFVFARRCRVFDLPLDRRRGVAVFG